MPPAASSGVEDGDTADITVTDPMIRVSPDKSELVRLDRDAISVVVGNPSHLSVLLDTSRLLVLIPKAPGATYFTALDANGDVIMQRHVVVGSPKKNYVRVRRSCANAARGTTCNATSVYYCPDTCHEIDVTQVNQNERPSRAPTIPKETPAASGSKDEE